jgi:hypothetical protein
VIKELSDERIKKVIQSSSELTREQTIELRAKQIDMFYESKLQMKDDPDCAFFAGILE